MTVWKYSISWSKFKLGRECPQALQWTIEKRKWSDFGPTYYAVLGKAVQHIFELYFNQQVNLRDGGQEPAVILKVQERVLKSDWLEKQQVVYPHNRKEADLLKAINEQVVNGFKLLKDTGLLNEQVRSEVKWNSVFQGFRMFGMLDFLHQDSSRYYHVNDGKGSKEKNADPNQLLYYALGVAASGHKLGEGGFLYWNLGYEPVDMSPAALKRFADEEIKPHRKIFDQLRHGWNDFPTNPSPTTCKYCPWRSTCDASYYKKPEQDTDQGDEVGFGENINGRV